MANIQCHRHRCNHEKVEYCKDCNKVYCINCKEEWEPRCRLQHYPNWIYTYDIPAIQTTGTSTTIPNPYPYEITCNGHSSEQ